MTYYVVKEKWMSSIIFTSEEISEYRSSQKESDHLSSVLAVLGQKKHASFRPHYLLPSPTILLFPLPNSLKSKNIDQLPDLATIPDHRLHYQSLSISLFHSLEWMPLRRISCSISLAQYKVQAVTSNASGDPRSCRVEICFVTTLTGYKVNPNCRLVFCGNLASRL